jgi:hypothetical protein
MSPLYRVYGQLLASDFPFKTQLLPGSGSPDLTFSLVFSAPDYQEWQHVEPAVNNQNLLFLHCCQAYHVFHFVDLADFYIFPDKIICHLLDRDYDYQVEVILLGLVFSYWLERRGIRALHAAAVNLDGEGVAFLSTNAGGKSSLAMTLTAMGHPLLTDDILPIEQIGNRFIGYPSFPQMRMWPEVALHFVGSYEELELAHPAYDKRRVPVGRLGDFSTEAVPLSHIVLPQRRETKERQITLQAVPPAQAMMDLMAYSFAANYVEAAGLHAERFHFFGALVQSVPVYKLIYPSGLHLLPDVCQQIVDVLHSGGKLV